MSAASTAEKVCDLLEVVLLNAPISFRNLKDATGIERQTLTRLLVQLEDAGFVAEDDKGRRTPGDRLALILEGRPK